MRKEECNRIVADSTTQIILTEAIEQDFQFRRTRQKLKVMLWIWILMLGITQAVYLLAVSTEQTGGNLTLCAVKSVGCLLFGVIFALMMYGGVRLVACLSLLVNIPPIMDMIPAFRNFIGASPLLQFSVLLLCATVLLQFVIALYIFFSSNMRHYEKTMQNLGRKNRNKDG